MLCNDQQINRLLQTVLDVETLFSLIFKEEDADTKQIYYFLFKLLRKSILNTNEPAGKSSENSPINKSNFPASVEAHLGKPPFEEPSITKGIINFLFCKYGKSGDLELQYMFEASKLFLYCLNMWKFESPAVFSKRISCADSVNQTVNDLQATSFSSQQQKLISLYKLNYTRWMCYNYVPSFCDSLEKYETIMIFGISFLKLVFSLVRQEIQEKFINEREKIPSDKRIIFCNYLPRFV